MSKEIDIYYQKLYKKYKKKYLSLKNQNAGANNIYFIIKLKDNFDIFSNYNSTFILKNKNIFASGKNSYGQLGLGKKYKEIRTFYKITLPYKKIAKMVSVGKTHTMILTEDGTVFACGDNYWGQLGLNNNNNQDTFTVVPLPEGTVVKQVICGDEISMILTDDGKVFTCGKNMDGQLGLQDRGFDAVWNTFIEVTSLPQGTVVKQMVAGGEHTMILAENGTVFACGSNLFGQLGLSGNYKLNTFNAINLGNKIVKQVAAGSGHTIILTEENTVFSCGNNKYGQLGLNNKNEYKNSFTKINLDNSMVVKQVAACKDYTMILTEDGRVFGCGNNYEGQFCIDDKEYFDEELKKYLPGIKTFTLVTTIPKDKNPKKILTGTSHIIILAEDDTVFACGSNEDGQLGLGSHYYSSLYNFEEIKLEEKMSSFLLTSFNNQKGKSEIHHNIKSDLVNNK